MTARSGINAQCGVKSESVWPVPVAVDSFFPLVSESLTQDIARLESEAIIAGQRVIRSQQWQPGARTAGGDLGFEVTDLSQQVLWEHMLGTISGAGPYTATPGDLTGKSMTVQIGKPDGTDGTVRPFTYPGSKVASWELACVAGEIPTLGLTLTSKCEIRHRTVVDGATTNTDPTVTSATAAFSADDLFKPIAGTGIPAASYVGVVTSATSIELSSTNTVHTPVNATATATGLTLTIGIALASVSYASGIMPLSFIESYLTIAGASYPVHGVTLTGDNGLNTDRRFLGSGDVGEQLEVSLRKYGGTIDSDYLSNTAYERFVKGTEAALVVTIGRGAKSVVVTENVRFDGTTPNVGGREVIAQPLPFTAVGTTTDASAITAVITQ